MAVIRREHDSSVTFAASRQHAEESSFPSFMKLVY